MDAFSGIYYVNDGDHKKATLLFLKDKLSIGLTSDSGNPLVIYWYYDKISRETIWNGKRSIIKYPGYPLQVIETESKEFAEKMEEVFDRKNLPAIRRVLGPQAMPIVKFALLLIGFLLLVYFWLIPFLAVRMAARVPISYEVSLGNTIFHTIKSGYTADKEKTNYVNEFFRTMKINSPYDIRILVVKENVANAFAMPGGNIIIYDKILAGMTRYEELAALLTHEFTHVNERHTTKSLFRNLGTAIFFSVLIGDAGAVATILTNHANKLKSLSYSRNLEKEADLQGLKLLAERKIDCTGFIGLFGVLKKESPAELTEWINSHPNLDKRIEYIRENEYFNRNGVMKHEALQHLFLRIKTSG